MTHLASPYHFTPKTMAKFSRLRIDRMDHALLEVAGCYGDINQLIVDECDRLRDEFSALRELINEMETEGRML